MTRFHADATVTGYAEWPKGTPNYWALPAMGDVVGWTYRKDWFDHVPSSSPSSRRSTAATWPPPTTWTELKQIAEFFQGREIDGKTVYGASIFTERGSEGITMGAMDVLYSFGFKYENPDKPYDMEGFVNSDSSVAGLEFYKSLYDCCTPPGSSDSYMGEGLDAFKSGQVAMHDELVRLHLAGPRRRTKNVGGDKIGFFVNPGEKVRMASTLGGQGISVVSYSDAQEDALKYIKWFAQPDVQKKWWSLGGFSCLKAVVEDPGFAASQPYAQTFLDSMAIVKDFWAEPSYATLLQASQKRLHDYVVAGQGTAKEALDGLVADWTEVFEDDGKL